MTIDTFSVITVKFDKKYNTPHQLFVKEHNVREKTDDRPRELTLFVCNIPVYCTKKSLETLFSVYGPIKDVFFATAESPNTILPEQDSKLFRKPEPEGPKVAYIVFVTPQGLHNVLLGNSKTVPSLSTNECPIVTGLQKYYQKYINPDPMEIMAEVDEYMKKYDETQKLKSESEKMAAEPDDDGWTTVTRSGRKPGFARRTSTVTNDGKRQKRKKKELVNFYTFQIKESKMKHLAALRKQFEQDKKIIEEMKAKRKFNPF